MKLRNRSAFSFTKRFPVVIIPLYRYVFLTSEKSLAIKRNGEIFFTITRDSLQLTLTPFFFVLRLLCKRKKPSFGKAMIHESGTDPRNPFRKASVVSLEKSSLYSLDTICVTWGPTYSSCEAYSLSHIWGWGCHSHTESGTIFDYSHMMKRTAKSKIYISWITTCHSRT